MGQAILEALWLEDHRPETALRRCNEREWGSWTEEFITVAEERAVYFVPLYDIGYENYAVYFRIAGR